MQISRCKCLECKSLGLKSLGSIVKAEMSRSKNPRSKVEVKLSRRKCRSAIVSVQMSKAQKSRVYVPKAQISRRMSLPPKNDSFFEKLQEIVKIRHSK